MHKNNVSAFIKHPLLLFLLRRLAIMFFMLFLLGFAIFGLMQLAPGDIVDTYISSYLFSSDGDNTDNQFTDEMIRGAKARLGLDKPFYIQYFYWLKQLIIDQDLGRSLITRAPILFLIKQRMINSLVFNLISLIVLTVLSFMISIFFAAFGTSKFDVIIALSAIILRSIPGVLMLTILQLFAALSGWFPIFGYPNFSFLEAPLTFIFSYSYHIFLPLFGAFLLGIGSTLRYVRATMLDQLGKPFITLLKSRGISKKRILYAHAFKNTLNPYITNSATLIASLFSGSLIMEVIFSYPGMGQLIYEAARQEDINLVIANLMFISFLVLSGMVIADFLLAVIDPRIRFQKTEQ